MLELIVGVLLAAGISYYVLLPILRPPIEPATTSSSDEGEDPADDMSPQTVALRALKEIEFDRATGKLSDPDYEHLKAKYTSAALAALRGETVPTPGGSPGFTKPQPTVSCPTHGLRPEKDAHFCSECGRRLGKASAYCVRCGTSLETDARYCNACGARVAA